MNIPLCHKCADGLFALNVDCPHKSQTYMGCRRDSRITNYDLAKVYCPILPAPIDVEVTVTSISKSVTKKSNRLAPAEWGKRFGIQVVDPDGWRGTSPDWNTPITQDMYVSRCQASTIRIVDRALYAKWRHIFEKNG